MILLNKYIFPSRDKSCFLFQGGYVLNTTFIMFSFILMPFLCTTKPRKSHTCTPKAHFNGFILSPNFLIPSNDCWRWSIWPFSDEDLMNISSIYTWIHFSIIMKHWFHYPLVCCTSIFQAERNYHPFIISHGLRALKCHFRHIFLYNKKFVYIQSNHLKDLGTQN